MKKAVLVLFIVKKQQVLARGSLITVENLEPHLSFDSVNIPAASFFRPLCLQTLETSQLKGTQMPF